jgi:hypothetical protein
MTGFTIGGYGSQCFLNTLLQQFCELTYSTLNNAEVFCINAFRPINKKTKVFLNST